MMKPINLTRAIVLVAITMLAAGFIILSGGEEDSKKLAFALIAGAVLLVGARGSYDLIKRRQHKK